MIDYDTNLMARKTGMLVGQFGWMLAILLFSWNYAPAQSSETDTWSGEVRARGLLLGRYYPQQSERSLYQWQGEGRLEVEGTLDYGDHWQAKAVLLANGNPDHQRRNRLWMNEAFLQYRKKHLVVKAGKQTVKWGSLAGFSALDLLNRYDYYDVLDTERERLGLWGLEGRLHKGNTELLLRAYAPDNRSRLHLQDNRWIHLPQQMPMPGDPETEVPLTYTGHTSDYPTNLPLLGASFSTELDRLQLRMSWSTGTNDIPLHRIRADVAGGMSVEYALELQHEPIMISAINLGGWFGDWNIWAEAAHVRGWRLDDALEQERDPYTFASIGVDRFWQFRHPERHLRLMGQFIQVFSAAGTEYAPTEIDHIFQTSVLLDADLQLSYTWHATLRSVAELRTSSYYLEPGIVCAPTDRLRLALRASLLGGDADGFFGYFRSNSRISITITQELL